MTPVVYLIVDILDSEILPRFLGIAVDLVDDIVWTYGEMMGEKLGECGEKVQLFNAILGGTAGLVV